MLSKYHHLYCTKYFACLLVFLFIFPFLLVGSVYVFQQYAEYESETDFDYPSIEGTLKCQVQNYTFTLHNSRQNIQVNAIIANDTQNILRDQCYIGKNVAYYRFFSEACQVCNQTKITEELDKKFYNKTEFDCHVNNICDTFLKWDDDLPRKDPGAKIFTILVGTVLCFSMICAIICAINSIIELRRMYYDQILLRISLLNTQLSPL
jgi:hypothetical protein